MLCTINNKEITPTKTVYKEQRGFLRGIYYTLRYGRGQLLEAGKLFQQVLEVMLSVCTVYFHNNLLFKTTNYKTSQHIYGT